MDDLRKPFEQGMLKEALRKAERYGILDAESPIMVAARRWDEFPADEDIEMLARRYAFSFTVDSSGQATEWKDLKGWQRTQFLENARSDLEAVKEG